MQLLPTAQLHTSLRGSGILKDQLSLDQARSHSRHASDEHIPWEVPEGLSQTVLAGCGALCAISVHAGLRRRKQHQWLMHRGQRHVMCAADGKVEDVSDPPSTSSASSTGQPESTLGSATSLVGRHNRPLSKLLLPVVCDWLVQSLLEGSLDDNPKIVTADSKDASQEGPSDGSVEEWAAVLRLEELAYIEMPKVNFKLKYILAQNGLEALLTEAGGYECLVIVWSNIEGRPLWGVGMAPTERMGLRLACKAVLKQVPTRMLNSIGLGEKTAKPAAFKPPVKRIILNQLGSPAVQAKMKSLLSNPLERQQRLTSLASACDRLDRYFDDQTHMGGPPRGRSVQERREVWSQCVQKPRRRFKVQPDSPRRHELLGKLPATSVREAISAALVDSQVVIASGGTGSGKSTQLPQFLLDDFERWEVEPKFLSKELRPPSIVVTQPRRMAALSIAERVAWEREQEEGFQVGHAVRGDMIRPTTKNGFIEYCTVGTLLRRSLSDPLLSRFNIIVIDEVHERDISTDFLLIVLRGLLNKRPDLRLVLMSATIDVKVFKRYLPEAQEVEIPSASRFPVQEIYLGDSFFKNMPEAAALLEGEFEWRRNQARERELQAEEDARSAAALQSEDNFSEDEVNYMYDAWLSGDGASGGKSRRTSKGSGSSPREATEVTKDLEWFADGQNSSEKALIGLVAKTILQLLPRVEEMQAEIGGVTGSLLVFLPGWREIQEVMRRLKSHQESEQLWILPLHSSIPKDQQGLVFEAPEPGKVKVILATNIAESSVTIDDVLVVVDSGLQRTNTYDSTTRVSSLDTVWVSASNAVQRKGRAGRVREGSVYRLYSKELFELLPWRTAPEMQRSDLASLCLQTISLGKDPRQFLQRAPDPPPEVAVQAAMEELLAIGAINDAPLEVQPLGRFLGRLPMHPLTGRTLLLGTMLGIPEKTAGLIAASTGRSIFITPEASQREEARELRRSFCAWSDPIGELNAMSQYEELVREEGIEAATEWARESFMDPISLAISSRVKYQLLQELDKSGIIGLDSKGLEKAFQKYNSFVSPGMMQEGSIMEAADLNVTGLPQREWLRELRNMEDESGTSSADLADPAVYAGLLCALYPANMSLRNPKGTVWTTRTACAQVNQRSVNGRDSRPPSGGPPWVVYSEMRVSSGMTLLSNTTYLGLWQIVLFAGLDVDMQQTVTGPDGEEQAGIRLEDWIDICAPEVDVEDLLEFARIAREEVWSGITWAVLAAYGDNVAKAARARSAAICQIFGRCLARKPIPFQLLKFVRDFRLPKYKPVARSNQDEGQRQRELKRMLWQFPPSKLKAKLSSLGLNTHGSKDVLVDRCALALAKTISSSY